MKRIATTFEKTRQHNRIALMPYLPIGYPSVETTLALAPALVEAGADLFELGVPYSDPQADGATIQHATHQALQNGITPRVCLDVAEKIRRTVEVPLLFMCYYNPIARFGDDRFCRAAAEAGVDGLIVPDLPPEEAEELRGAANAHHLDLPFLVAPTSTDERLTAVTQAASGFIYCVSLSGVTGARAQVAAGLGEYLAQVRHFTELPLAVGFGISKPEHVREVARHADGAIMGAALVDCLDRLAPEQQVGGAARYVRELAAATGRGSPPVQGRPNR